MSHIHPRTAYMIFLRRALTALLTLCASAGLFAQQSPHGTITIDCQECHTTKGWKELRAVSTFDHDARTPFSLVGKHASVRCIECHTTLVFADAGTQCLDCHTDVHRGQFTSDCERCHSARDWADRSAFEKMHEATRFPLVGLHRDLDCQSCHADGQYVNLPVTCSGCHMEQYAATSLPSHQQAGFSLDCQQCHSVTKAAWKGAVFAHPQTFPLTGGHANHDCQACHANGYEQISTECVSCHQADYAATQNPQHEAPAFPTSCQECHTTTAWEPAQFTRHNDTAFPLTGAHVSVDCARCHVDGQYTGTTTACGECHQEDYAQADNPVHTPALFPTTCEACHTTAAWSGATFGSHDQTAFPLTGAHVQAACQACHSAGYTGTPTACWACHEGDYNGTTDPNHVQEQYPQSCEVCHTTDQWDGAVFDHNATQFPLTGAHVQTDCQACHSAGYAGTPTDCWSCHQEDYNGTTDPNHATEQYPQNCTVCHSTNNWTESTFDHSATQFPLTGAHVQANCVACHANGYSGTPTDCWSCHEADNNGAENHSAQQYPHDCALCHNTSDWEDADFNHNNTGFPLTGAHVQVNCQACHTSGYDGTPTDCWSCHQSDYNNAEDHVAQQYPHDCALCHNTSDWDGANFNHNNTNFPLTGAHVEVNCQQCHANGYEGTPTDCWSCHQEDYNEAEDHVQENYPHDCTLCHNTSDWDDGFNHNNTNFPLTGTHIGTDCALCHVGGQYEGTPTACFACHDDDFNGASPDHNTGYPQACEECHTTTNWNSNFNHDSQYFPINSGRHRNEWNLCVDCHLGGNFATFSCIDCHEHSNQGDVDDEHDEVGGYTYTPTSCYECHPDGNEVRGPGDTPISKTKRKGGDKR